MQIYKNLDGDSGIYAYEYGDNYIKVKFKKTGDTYVYDNASTGENDVNEMKRLADEGRGLNEYINRKVRSRYAYKE